MQNDEYNWVSAAMHPDDVRLFLGPLDPEVDAPLQVLPPEWQLAHVAHACGFFPSVGQARKNGWAGPVPPGYSEYTFSKRRVRLYILSPYPGMLAG